MMIIWIVTNIFLIIEIRSFDPPNNFDYRNDDHLIGNIFLIIFYQSYDLEKFVNQMIGERWFKTFAESSFGLIYDLNNLGNHLLAYNHSKSLKSQSFDPPNIFNHRNSNHLILQMFGILEILDPLDPGLWKHLGTQPPPLPATSLHPSLDFKVGP